MKKVPRYLTSVPIQNHQTEFMKISLGFDMNGAMGLYFGDTAELDQDSNYINEASFPNSGLLANGKYSMWISMFTRHILPTFEDDE